MWIFTINVKTLNQEGHFLGRETDIILNEGKSAKILQYLL